MSIATSRGTEHNCVLLVGMVPVVTGAGIVANAWLFVLAFLGYATLCRVAGQPYSDLRRSRWSATYMKGK